ncbi:MAG: MFS transporter [Armatimonadota bacterium]|nr:MAG: MFS transporter [Armatimonadota bacterium]
MFERLERAYIALFREYPPLIRLAVVTGAGQLAFALLNNYALPIYLLQDLRLSGKALGAISATFLLCETLLKFPMGRLSDRFGRRPFVALGPLLICLNPIIIVRLPVSLWALVFPVRAADGAGAAALWPPLYATVGDLVKKESRAAAMSVMNTVYVLAMGGAVVVGSFAAYLLASNRAPFYIASALLFISGAVAVIALPRADRRVAAQSSDAAALMPMVPASAQPPLPAPDRAYPLPLVMLISLLMTLGVLMLANFAIPYLKLELELSPLHIGTLVITLGIPVGLLGLPLGHAADRWGKTLAVRVSLVASAALMWLIPSCRTMPAFAAVGTLLVLSHVLGTPAWLAIVSELAPTSRRGGVMGIVATAQGVGAAVAPLIAGSLWDIGPPYVFYGSAVMLTLGALVAGLTLRARTGDA